MLPKFSTLIACFRSLPSICLGLALLFLAGTGAAGAQSAVRSASVSPVPDRLMHPIDESARVTLGNSVHPLANRANDRGAVGDALRLDRLQIVLKRSDAQEADLKQLIADMHTSGNAAYHKWLTPDDFGKRFGPSDSDVAKLSAWLQSHGFNVTKLNPGRQTLEFSGSAGQFRDTFKAQIHTFQVSGENGLESHFANAADPQIPAALAPVFGGFASLNNFRFKRNSRQLGTASYNPATHATKPDWTVGTNDAFHLVLAPADFAVQYAIPSQATPGTNDGTGQSIAIVNDANINISIVNRFRALFGLPANPPQVIIDGNDPGVDGNNDPTGPHPLDTGEAYLDVEWAGAIAPAATINLVIGADTALENGLAFGAERAVYSNISPIISLSFGNCEADLLSSNAFFSGLWEQAAAQGITVVVSTGDSGSASCDAASQSYAVGGQAVSGFASTPYNVAVGGTDFYYANGSSDLKNYWSLTPSNATPKVSLGTPVPEQAWNDSQYGSDLLSYYANTGDTTIAAGSGGPSTLGLGTTVNGNTTYGPYPKPLWQKGFGDSVRDIPDLSLFASDGSNGTFYPICQEDGDCQPVASGGDVQISGVGGTSASTPAFAGIMALVNQQYGRQGQAAFVLYPLAAQYHAAFNDVKVGTNTVPCALGSPDCQTVTNPLTAADDTSEGEIGLSAGTPAYNAVAGYDLATGLGSVNVGTLLTDWNKVTFAATAVTLTPSPASFTHGTAITISGNVTGTGTPTGDVALMTDSTTQNQAGQTFFTLSGGAYSQTVGFLPGGTYNIWGNYGGDFANAPSSSIANKVQVTVAPEPSVTSLQLFSGYDNSGRPVAAPASVPYGTQVLLSAQPAPSSGSKTDSIPTGNIAFTDGGAALNTALLNAEGDAEYYSVYSPGTHTIKAAYPGDASYSPSNSSTATLSVTQDAPTFNVVISNQDQNSGTTFGPQATYLIVTFENSNSYSQNALAPTGTVTVTGGPSGPLSGTLSPGVDPNTLAAVGAVTLALPSGITSGTLDLTFTYAGDKNYSGVTAGPYGFPFASSGSLLTSSTTVAATPATGGPAASVQLTTTITGQSGKGAPTGTISVYGPNVTFGQFALPAGSGDTTVVTLTFDSSSLLQGSNQFAVQYSGDSVYLPSAGTATVSNPLSDFQMLPLTTILDAGTTGTATDTINLASTNSFAGAVALSCKGASGVTCSLSPASATLAAGGSTAVTLTVNSTAVTKIGTYNVVVTGSDATGNYIHTLGFQVVVPQIVAATTGSVTLSATTPITVASQGASATSTVTVTPTGGFAGNVALTCAVTTSPSGASETPTCAVTPASVSISGGAAATATLSVNTTAQTTSTLKMLFPLGGGATLAALFLMGGPLGRRGRLTLKAVRTVRLFSAAALFALIATAAIGCGSGSHSSSGGGGGGTTTGGTTTGAYVVTITATPGTGTPVTTAVNVTVN